MGKHSSGSTCVSTAQTVCRVGVSCLEGKASNLAARYGSVITSCKHKSRLLLIMPSMRTYSLSCMLVTHHRHRQAPSCGQQQRALTSRLFACVLLVRHSYARQAIVPIPQAHCQTYCGVQCSCATRTPTTILFKPKHSSLRGSLNLSGGGMSWPGPNNCVKASLASSTTRQVPAAVKDTLLHNAQ